MMRQRFYIDGKLIKSTGPYTPERARQYIDNVERLWLAHGLEPLTPVGQSDFNHCHQCTRVSADEIIVVTTAGRTLRTVNVPAKEKAETP